MSKEPVPGSLDIVELARAFEEQFPGWQWPEDATPEQMLAIIREHLDDDPDGPLAVWVCSRGPAGRGGASASPES